MAFHADGNWMATASTDKTVGLWHAETGLLRNRLRAFKSAVLAVKFLPFGPFVCAGSLDKACSVFHILTGELKFSLSAHTSGITSLAISSDGVLLTSSSDADVRVWDLRMPWPEVLVALHCRPALVAAYSTPSMPRAWSSSLVSPVSGEEGGEPAC